MTTRRAATRNQHAIRLLALLHYCGDPIGGGDPESAVRVIRSERRLQALDFWLRNPDYLADAILRAVEAGRVPSSRLTTAKALLSNPEPDLRHYPTPKWFFGAYEPVDDAFALLEMYGLAFVRRLGVPPVRRRTQFFLTEAGAAAGTEMATTPVLDWYVSQSRLVGEVAGNDTGTELKVRQYTQSEAYAAATWGSTIGSIADQVEERLDVALGGGGHVAGAPAAPTQEGT